MSCGTHSYGNITKNKMDAILKALTDNGASISGNNPWDVDTNNNKVKLRGEWNEAASTLNITVNDSNWYVPCSKIWETVDDLMHHIQALPDTALPS
ncbi:MAG: hypothetical protein H7843_16310 [Nitrospirota bacterium]